MTTKNSRTATKSSVVFMVERLLGADRYRVWSPARLKLLRSSNLLLSWHRSSSRGRWRSAKALGNVGMCWQGLDVFMAGDVVPMKELDPGSTALPSGFSAEHRFQCHSCC